MEPIAFITLTQLDGSLYAVRVDKVISVADNYSGAWLWIEGGTPVAVQESRLAVMDMMIEVYQKVFDANEAPGWHLGNQT